VDVSWNRDCQGYRLPTEVEWEWAARAGTTAAYQNGDSKAKLKCEPDAQLDQIAWYCGNSTVTYAGCVDATGVGGPRCGGTHPVAQKQANAWGLYDMAGNVFEWVWDLYGFYPTDSSHSENYGGSGWRRVSRGGAWYGYGSFCRSALRNHDSPGAKGNGLGLRVARTAFDQPAEPAASK
jgi:formylglycine-generating enzyme required for sulfatase activity